MNRLLLLVFTHAGVLVIGFALGVYALPILTAPSGPSQAEVESVASNASYSGEFRRDLADSDLLHWGEGKVYVQPDSIALMGRIAPGPDYKLYLVPEFVETEADFLRIKAQSRRVADIKTFENFVVPVGDGIDLTQYNTVLIWCESFGQFITAAQYR